MHIMGVRGHPEGKTVLSYFTTHVDSLLPLDKAMLRAFYAPRARAGMTPFELLPILADQLVAITPDKQAAQASRDRFLARTFKEMQAFAEGQGDIPMIVKRCGKATQTGMLFGRTEMSYFLGVAYEQGATVKQDSALALRWLQRAGGMGSRSAQARLASTDGSALVGAAKRG
jgi:TPR repeat protein